VFAFIFVVDAFSVNIVVVGIEACVLDILCTSNVNTWFSVGLGEFRMVVHLQ
jgi:hypothetical protein